MMTCARKRSLWKGVLLNVAQVKGNVVLSFICEWEVKRGWVISEKKFLPHSKGILSVVFEWEVKRGCVIKEKTFATKLCCYLFLSFM